MKKLVRALGLTISLLSAPAAAWSAGARVMPKLRGLVGAGAAARHTPFAAHSTLSRARLLSQRRRCAPALLGACSAVAVGGVDRSDDGTADVERAAEFSRWLAGRGGKGIGSVVSVRESSVGGWGLFAETDIRQGDPLLVLPVSALSLSEESAEESEYYDGLQSAVQELYGFSSETPQGCPFIAVQLLLHAQHGSASDWAPYLDMLPWERRAGWRWTSPGLPKALEQDAAEIRESVKHEFAHLKRQVFEKHRDVFLLDFFTLERYEWAKDMVLSRAYAVQGLGGLVCLLPGIDMANHATDVEYGVRQLEAEDAACGMPGTEDWATTEQDDELVGLVADRNYKRGDEVWSSYGPLDKSRLLLFFGFAPSLAADSLRINIAIPNDGVQDSRLKLLEAHGLCGSSRLELTGSGVAGGSGRAGAPSEEVLAFARVCALSADDVVRAADALHGEGEQGEGGRGRQALALFADEEERSGLLLLRRAIVEAVGVVGGDGRREAERSDVSRSIQGATWPQDVVEQVEAGRHALAAAACGWIDDALENLKS